MEPTSKMLATVTKSLDNNDEVYIRIPQEVILSSAGGVLRVSFFASAAVIVGFAGTNDQTSLLQLPSQVFYNNLTVPRFAKFLFVRNLSGATIKYVFDFSQVSGEFERYA